MARVAIEGLTKQFRSADRKNICALDGLNLSISDGELLVLVGPSGSGKTTTLRLLAGLDEPTLGSIRIDDRDVTRLEPGERDIAMVFQNQALYPHLSVFENLAFGLELRKVPRPEIQARVNEAAAILGLSTSLQRRPDELSGGERQRVALGRALVRKLSLFLFDEPLSNLDPQQRLQMRAEISRLHSRLAATMIYVTHDQAEAMALADRIAVLNLGRLQQVSPPLELYRRPANVFVAGFIGSPPMNLVHGHLRQDGGALLFSPNAAPESAVGESAVALKFNAQTHPNLQSHVDREIVLGLRPEHFDWRHDSGGSSQPMLELVPEVVEQLGAETFVYFRWNSDSLIARAPASVQVEVNRKTRITFDPRQAHFFNRDSGMRI